MRRVCILGGGLTGLTIAYNLRKLARDTLHVTIIEQSPRLGGWIETKRTEEGFLFEKGPRGLR
jgi:oxygen-dependent protoporphyrinogen oxidase